MSTHSVVGASSMKRWRNCPGSVALCANIPNQTSEYAEEGTRAHKALEFRLTRGEWPGDMEPGMREHVQVHVDEVLADLARNEHDQDDMMIEVEVKLDAIIDGAWGTADTVIYKHTERRLIVIDYKHGAGHPVEVVENDQLRYYAVGVLLKTGFPAKEVELKIVQPRCFHKDGPVRKVVLSTLELLEFAADIRDAVLRTREPDAPLVPGDWCNSSFCPARAICPALANQSMAIAREEFAPATLSPDELGFRLSLIPRLEGWIKGVREHAYQEALHGRTPPGFKLVPKRATRRWTDEGEAARALQLLELAEADIFEAPSLKSPAQIEKILPKDKRKAIGQLVSAISSGYSLVPEKDDRESVDESAQKEFLPVSQP